MQDNGCHVQREQKPPHKLLAFVEVKDVPIAEKTYVVGKPPQFLGLVFSVAKEQGNAETNAQGGTMTISKITASSVSGNFSVNFQGGDAITGEFKARICRR